MKFYKKTKSDILQYINDKDLENIQNHYKMINQKGEILSILR